MASLSLGVKLDMVGIPVVRGEVGHGYRRLSLRVVLPHFTLIIRSHNILFKQAVTAIICVMQRDLLW